MNGLTIKTEFETYKGIKLRLGVYRADGSIAIEAWNVKDGPVAVLTVCLNDKSLNVVNETYLDTNNCPWVVDFMESNGLAERTGKVAKSGYCTYPVVSLNMQRIKQYEED